jgi:hypothetical protein
MSINFLKKTHTHPLELEIVKKIDFLPFSDTLGVFFLGCSKCEIFQKLLWMGDESM